MIRPNLRSSMDDELEDELAETELPLDDEDELDEDLAEDDSVDEDELEDSDLM